MAQEVKTRFKETPKSTKELPNAIEQASRQQAKKSALLVAHSPDRSFDGASKTLSDFESLSRKSSKEQLEPPGVQTLPSQAGRIRRRQSIRIGGGSTA